MTQSLKSFFLIYREVCGRTVRVEHARPAGHRTTRGNFGSARNFRGRPQKRWSHSRDRSDYRLVLKNLGIKLWHFFLFFFCFLQLHYCYFLYSVVCAFAVLQGHHPSLNNLCRLFLLLSLLVNIKY